MGSMFSSSGSTAKTKAFLQKAMRGPDLSKVETLAQQGVSALQSATPAVTGLTANSWSYEIETKGNTTTISWINTHTEEGVNIAVILQYGHGTGTGGYVSGRDYINPAIQPIFDSIADGVWKELTLA